jgi:hypothetical protein
MAFTLPPLNLSAGSSTGALDGASQVGTPINVSVPWQSTKNYQSHTSGSSQSATASADQSAGGSSFGGINMKWILLGAAAWLLLR